MVSTLAMTDALSKLLIEKGLITEAEFKKKLGEEKARNKGGKTVMSPLISSRTINLSSAKLLHAARLIQR